MAQDSRLVGSRADQILGRDAELARLRAVLDSPDCALLLTGPAGIGKSTLLEAVIARAAGFDVVRATSVEAESELPFATLHQLVRSLLPRAADLPERQRAALAGTLALEPSLPEHGFAAFAALVSLLGVCSEDRPLLLVVDDAQWADASSLAALAFAARRLAEDRVAIVAAARTPPEALKRWPELRVTPLAAGPARALAAIRAPHHLHDAALSRIVELAEGVPLAVVELAGRGGDLPVAADHLVERLFGERVGRLSGPAATAALVAALAEPDDAGTMLRAAAALDATLPAWEEAEAAAVLRLTAGRIEFVHPLLRAAVAGRASARATRAAHSALAAQLPEAPHRAIWHRAEAAIGPDEKIAAALECAAAEHRDRAGYVAAAQALRRSARLSPVPGERARRLILAGENARRAGRVEWADELAAEAAPGAHEPQLQARAELLRAHVEAWRGSVASAHRRYLRVARQASEHDQELAAIALGYAAAVAVVAGDSDAALAAALQARRMPAQQQSEATLVAVRESLGSVLALRGDSVSARPLLDEAVRWYERRPERIGAEYAAEALMWLGDYGRVGALLDDVIADCRRAGGLPMLSQTLVLRADLGYRTGHWALALADATEAVTLAGDAEQSIHSAYAHAMRAILEAARGDEERAREDATQAMALGQRHGLRVVDECAVFALAACELGQGRPEAALERLEPLAAAVAKTGRGEPAVVLWPADRIEALIATDRRDDAGAALKVLADQARRTGGAWAEGVVARYHGVLAPNGDLDPPFSRALACHERCGMPFELARTRLGYGERLRRAGRRIDARAQLREALVGFEGLGADRWAERARRELAATGQRLRRGPQRDRDRLTHQELQIARCVARGATNKEAAADLFLSPKTIETHLTRVYRKLGVRSRSELAVILRDE